MIVAGAIFTVRTVHPAERAFERGDRDEALRLMEDLAHVVIRDLFLPGGTRDDLLQEARFGILKGFRDFRSGNGARLRHFCSITARRQALTAVKLANVGHQRVLNDAASYSDPESGIEPLDGVDPAREVENRERLREAAATIRTLSSVERDALIGVVEGYSYEEIAEQTGRDVRSIDNGLQRARRKLERDPPPEAPPRAPSQPVPGVQRMPRKSRRTPLGLTKEAATAILGPCREAVITPDGRTILERRVEERRKDGSMSIWIPLGDAPLRTRFPHGALVRGPFITRGEMRFDPGEGMVDWTRASHWAVPARAVPVEVTIGNRWSGGYLPEELEVLALDADPNGFTP